MRFERFGILLAVLAVCAVTPARAEILISINKSTQQMIVNVDGDTRYVWPVSTGARGYDTPSGEFKPFRMEAEHYSQEWDDAPMPHSIFFTQQGHAIHGSNHRKAIGTPASHGCVRLEPKNAAILFALVKHEKMANTHVVLTGETPGGDAVMAQRDPTRIMNEEDDGFLTNVPVRRRRSARGWSETHEGPSYFYFRDAPAPRRTYGAGFPFGW